MIGFSQLLLLLSLIVSRFICSNFPTIHPIYLKLENYYAQIENINVSFPETTADFKRAEILQFNKIKHEQEPIFKDVFYSSPPLPPKSQALIDSGTKLDYTYAIFKNVYVNPFSTFGYNGSFFFKMQYTLHFSVRRFIKKSGQLKHLCNEFVLVGNQLARYSFGHMHEDVLLPMLLIPDEVRERAYVFCPPNNPLFKEGLQLIGFKEQKILLVDEDEWMYANMYHTILNPLPFLCYYGKCCRKFHQIIVDTYNLSNVKNDQYVFCNRDKGFCRHITNIDEVFNQTKLQYPQYDWKYLIDIFPTLKETFINWITVKFMFLPTGSNTHKCLAMKPGSVMVVATSCDNFDSAAMRIISSSDVFNIWFTVPGMKHFKIQPNYVNVTDAIKAIDIGIYAADHQKLPTWK